jgi:exonuclease SbcC
MKIERVKLRGFVGLKKGLGKDEISLDLAGLSGLIALAGPNGKGKSTLLENLSPFRTLASRKGSLQHHTFLRDSLKELAFRWNGDLFETVVKVDSQSGKGEAFIYKNGQPEIKGKSSEYDRYMRSLLGSEELFFASVFCAQNSEKLSDMTTGQLKSLFSEFLRLEKLIAYEDLSKRCAVTLIGQAKALDGEGQYLEIETKKKEDLTQRASWVNRTIEVKADALANTRARIILLEDSLKALRQAVEDNRVHEARLKDLQAQGAKLAADWKRDQESAQRGIKDLKDKALQVAQEITTTSRLIERKAEIEGAVKKEAELTKEIQETNDAATKCYDALNAVHASIGENGKKMAELTSAIQAIAYDEQVTKLRNTVSSLREKKELLEKRDPACTSRTCAFIVSALKAEELPVIEKALQDRLALLKERETGLMNDYAGVEKTLQQDTTRKQALEKKSNALAATLTSLKVELRKAQALSSLKSQLDTATAKLEGLQVRQKELSTELMSASNALIDRETEYKTASGENAALVLEAQGNVDPLAAENLSAEERNLKDLQTSKERTEAEITALKGDLASLEAQIKGLEEKERRLSEIREKRGVILREASEWEYLKNACSKDGLRALEIASVTPTIMAYGNKLLQGAFGPNASIKIDTLDDEGREVFHIKVIDDDGDEVILGNRSGGQQIWPLKAIRLAMTILSKERSGRDFLSAFADEEDGGLDLDNARSFIQMYRSFVAEGHFESLFYVSHKEACVEMADHTIRFLNGHIEMD